MSVPLSIPLILSTSVHTIDFLLAGWTSEDPRKRSVECEVVRRSGSLEFGEQRPQRLQAIGTPGAGLLVLNRDTALVYLNSPKSLWIKAWAK